MKSIPNRKILLESETLNKPEETTYAKLLIAIASNVAGKGANRGEQKQRLRIIRAAKTADAKILLEDADYDVAKALVDAFPWGIVSEQIDEFCDLFDKPETIDVKALADGASKRKAS